MYYTRPTTWNIVDRGKERQAKFVGLQKWGLRLVIDSLSVMLQFALLLFGVALTIYLWELDPPTAEAVLAITSIGFAFYTFITLLATIFRDCPFQTPLSFLLPNVLPWMKEFAALARVRLRREATSLPLPILRVLRILTSEKNPPDHAEEEAPNNDYQTIHPKFWRNEPLFTSPILKDIVAYAGFWLLENSTDSSAVSAVAVVFSELQWPSNDRSTSTALVRLRDTYAECLRAPDFNESARLRALESAAAYYVLYHDRFIWNNSNGSEVDARWLPPDLLLHQASNKWGGDDTFEYLLHTTDHRTESVTSPRFLSYLAPYWFCGDSDSAIRFRWSRLYILYELIEVLEANRAFDLVTLTDCLLCAGAAMDFPLHPEDLIRTDKRYVLLPRVSTVALIAGSHYVGQTFKLVVEHVHGLILARRPQYTRRGATKTALDILVTLVRKAPLPLVDAWWINELLQSASRGNMGDDTFTLFLRLSALRKEGDAAADAESPAGQDYTHIPPDEMDPQSSILAASSETATTPESSLCIKILQNIRACSENNGWQDEAVYGGLIAMKDIPRLGSLSPDKDSLRMLFKAMEKSQPFPVRKAAYDVVLIAREGWLRSADLRPDLEEWDFPRQLHNVVIETGRSDHQRSLLIMMEILSEDRYWHSYLRGAMDIWLPFRHEGQDQVIRILTRVGELPPRDYDGFNPLDKFLEQFVEDEWAAVPGCPLVDLTADRLKPLVESTTQFKELLFTEVDRKAVLAVVERVVPALEKRREDGYEGPGDEIREMVGTLIEILQIPVPSTSRRSTYW